ncbi:MAG: hypothetical protein QXM08_00930 [Thermofilaceae archaeon]
MPEREVVIPVKTLVREESEGFVKHVFYGYRLAIEDAPVVKVLDAGIYERAFSSSDPVPEVFHSAREVKRLGELSREEMVELASATPLWLLPALQRSGFSVLASIVVAEALRQEPEKVAEASDALVRRCFSEACNPENDALIRTALLETTPEMIEVIRAQLLSRGVLESDILALLSNRHLEEVLEEEQVERARKASRPAEKKLLVTQ